MKGYVTPLEQEELARVAAGGTFQESFWYSRLQEAMEHRPLLVLQRQLHQSIQQVQAMPVSVEQQRKLRRLRARARKADAAYEKLRYPQCQTDEEARIDNLRSAAVMISRAWNGVR